MQVEHHHLVDEFPEFRGKIHQLQSEDQYFANLYREYERLDKEVYRIEAHDNNTSDEHLETLKKQRVLLKDQLYHLLNK